MQYIQTETSECGLICLAYVSKQLGAEFDVSELRRRFSVSSRGLSIKHLSEIAAALNLMARAVKCELEELADLRLPAILHWGINHFVVLKKVERNFVVIHDPARGRVRLRKDEVNRFFTGVALELSPSPQFTPRRTKSPLTIWSWIRFSPEVFAGAGQVLILSVLLQIYVIASPFYMQLAIDQAALRGDNDLLLVLAVGFGLFAMFNAVAALLRNFAIQQLAAHTSWDMSMRLFRHMVRLPLPWFQKRHLSDTIQRFDSINPIRDMISGGVVSSVIDGLFAISTITMMFIFSPPLASFALLGVAVAVAIRLGSLPVVMRLSSESLTSQIAENGKRLETIKAIQTIKLMSAETEQETQWAGRFAKYVKKNLHSSRFQITVDSLSQAIDACITTAVIYLGATAIIQGKMTVGVLYAFMSYRGQFASAMTKIMEQAIHWKLTDIYSYRLAEIVLSPKENGLDRVDLHLPDISGHIEVDNVHFRYSDYEQFVLKGINLEIRPGEFIAVVGPSGIGKSSLLKLLCGLYTPTSGEVRVDGQSISALGPNALRRQCGVVMQDDELLSGTIAENVAFFDEKIDMDRVWASLEAAALKAEIMAMPMKTETYLGDMGGSLSGGQRQRLLIARALYKRPKILLLDEATSHLDVQNEMIINESLRTLNITRIIIAHRLETIRAADRIYDLSVGEFVNTQHSSSKPMEAQTSG